MAKDHAHKRSEDGRDYVCAQCGAPIPDGVLVAARWTQGGKVSGVKVTNHDGDVLHECGATITGDGRG